MGAHGGVETPFFADFAAADAKSRERTLGKAVRGERRAAEDA